MGPKELLCLLEERLVQHDNSRKEVQGKLQDIYSESIKEVDLLEEKLSEDLQRYFNSTEERILSLIEKLNNSTQKKDLDSLTTEALKVLSVKPRFKIKRIENADNFADSHTFKITNINLDINTEEGNGNGNENIIRQLQEHLDLIHETIISTQNKLTEAWTKKRTETEEFKKKIDGDMEGKFNTEDSRLQAAINRLRENTTTSAEDVSEVIQRAKMALLVKQSYEIIKCNYENKVNEEKEKPKFYFMNMYELKTERSTYLNIINFEERKPTNLISSFTANREFSLSFTFFSADEIEIIKTATTKTIFNLTIKIWEKNKSEEKDSKTITKEYNTENKQQICFYKSFNPNTTYNLKMKIEYKDLSSKWSDEIEFMPEFKDLCIWKECPEEIEDESCQYCIYENNPRIALKSSKKYGFCTIIGNIPLPLNKVSSWNIKILKSRNNDGADIFVGVAPFNIDQNEDYNHNNCGWYLNCYYSLLYSGPPHAYRKRYGLKKEKGEYVHTGDSVGIVMDTTTKGELSYVLNGVNFGVAYEGIPLDKPLVPCVILGYKDDSAELDLFSEVKENLNSSISIPSNITTKSDTWNSITLTWDVAEGDSFYQIEVDESKIWGISTTNTFSKIGFFPESEHSFRVRTVRNDAVSEWSDIIKVKTIKAPIFSECVWKECSDYVNENYIYSADKNNPKIAIKSNSLNPCCTIIGNTLLPPNKITLWNVKMFKLKSKYVSCIYVGVAPSDINQNEHKNSEKCGWYFDCGSSRLCSGPPHYYRSWEYGLRKIHKYVYTGDSVGIVMDTTTNGELSFILGGVNLGVAYKGIPLDKPLVPCVLLYCNGDSVELVI